VQAPEDRIAQAALDEPSAKVVDWQVEPIANPSRPSRL